MLAAASGTCAPPVSSNRFSSAPPAATGDEAPPVFVYVWLVTLAPLATAGTLVLPVSSKITESVLVATPGARPAPVSAKMLVSTPLAAAGDGAAPFSS